MSAASAEPSPAPRARTARALGALAVAALVLACLLFRLGAAPVTRSAEQRTYAVAAHMLESGAWLVPIERDGAPRLQKPPLYYWAAVAAAAPSGELSRFTLRLPAALSAVALLGVVFAWGRSQGGFATGAVSALLLLQMSQYWSVGRRGVAEMPLALFATLALFAFDRIYWGGRRHLVPLFFLCVLLGFLAKATTALLLIGLPAALELGLDRSLRRALRRDVLAWGSACACACLGWYAAVLWLVPGAWPVLREALLLPLGATTSIGSAAHVRPPWFYVPLLLGVASPALLLAPLAAARPAVAREIFRAPRGRFPLLCFASLLLAFSALPMKQKHYLAPLLPFLALSLGRLVVELHARCPDLLLRYLRGLGIALLAVSPLLAAVLVAHLLVARDAPPALCFAIGALLVLSAALAWAAARRGNLRAFAAASLLVSLTATTVHEASIRVWRARFDAGIAATEADIGGFERAFAAHPWLRRLYAGGD